MRIAIDARAWSWAGIGRYTRNLVRELLAHDDEHEYVIFTGKKDAKKVAQFLCDNFGDGSCHGGSTQPGAPVPLPHPASRDEPLGITPQSGSPAAVPPVSFRSHKKSASRYEVTVVEDSYYSWREQTVLRWQLQHIKADLFHFTHFNAPVHFNRPYVVTIHDATRFIFPGQQTQSWWQQVAYEYVFSRVLAGARGAITVSEATKRELAGLPLQLPQLVRTVHEGVEEAFLSTTTTRQRQTKSKHIGVSDPYLLYAGVWMSHKNLRRLLEACATVVQTHPGVKLVMTGTARPGYSQVQRWVDELNISSHVVFAGMVPASLLPALYAEATALAFPSLYEGFGLPALEAAAAGTPVITSNVTSLPEIMGEAARYVNPEHAVGIAAAMNQILDNAALGARLRQQGVARAATFTWQAAAAGHRELYKAVYELR